MVDPPEFSDDNVTFQGPPFHIDLAPLDALHPVYYSQRLYLFRCTSSAQRNAQLAAFKAGVQALVSRCPILGGIVVPFPPDKVIAGKEDWRTIVPDKGLELVVRDLRTSMPSFEVLEAADFDTLLFPYELLVPVPAGIGNDRPFAACKIQFSAIEGGTILTFATSHSVGDGSGVNELTRILSEETRLAQERPDKISEQSTQPSSDLPTVRDDRSFLCNITSDMEFNIEQHPAFRWKPMMDLNPTGPPPTHPFEATLPESPVLLHISAAGVKKLKEDATKPGAPFISTHDALSALIWRSMLLIRSRRSTQAQEVPASTMTNLFMPSDARRYLNLPASYIGNAVYQLSSELDLGTLLSPSGLQHAASAVRRAISNVNSDLVASYMAMLKEKWVDWEFLYSSSTTGVAMGTAWTSSSKYSDDWGKAFGPMVTYRFPGAHGHSGCTILPRLADGAAELVVGVLPQEVEMLKGDECFGKYLDL